MRLQFIVVALIVLSACQCQPPEAERCESVSEAEGRADLSYADLAPLIAASCVRCHRAGGLAPFALDTHEALVEFAPAVRASVVNRTMPPWMPATCCNSFANDISLSDQEVADIARWIDDGAPRGETPPVEEPVETGALPRVDALVTMQEPYLPAPPEGGIDDYRCFLVDNPLDEDVFVTGFQLVPGNPAVVHHAMVLTVPASLSGSLEARDNETEAPGWSCPGGGVEFSDGYVGAWSPGWDAVRTPEGRGYPLRADQRLVFSMHYSTPAFGEIAEDVSTLELMTVDEVDRELTAIAVLDASWPLGNMPIPRDQREVRFAAEFDPTVIVSAGQPLTVWGVNLHMHERGSAGSVTVRRASGDEDCLVQIDDYRHEWQGDYQMSEPVEIALGDTLLVECVFDNTAGRQRIVNGERRETPRDLNWGDDQEMCVAFVTIERPQ